MGKMVSQRPTRAAGSKTPRQPKGNENFDCSDSRGVNKLTVTLKVTVSFYSHASGLVMLFGKPICKFLFGFKGDDMESLVEEQFYPSKTFCLATPML